MMKNTLIGLLLVAAGVLAVAVVRQQTELAQLRATAAKSRAVAPAPVKHFPPTPVAKRKAPAVLPVPAPAVEGAGSNAVAETKESNFFAKIGEMTKDPAFKDMMRAQQKMMLDMQYGSLFKSLNLSAEDLDALKQLLADRQVAGMDAGLAMMNGDTSATNRAQRAAEIKQADAGYDKQIQDFLGADDYTVFKNYEATLGERTQVNLFKQSLAGAEPLTDQQEADLIAAMHQGRTTVANTDFMSSSTPNPTKFTEEGIAEMQKQLEQVNNNYLQSAATILSATQLEQFKKYLEQDRAMQTMGLKMAWQMFGKQQQQPASIAPKP